MLGRLGVLWSAWKFLAKRLGPVKGAVAALLVVPALVVLKRLLRDRAPRLYELLDRVV